MVKLIAGHFGWTIAQSKAAITLTGSAGIASVPILNSLTQKIYEIASHDDVITSLLINTVLAVIAIGLVVVDGFTGIVASRGRGEALSTTKAFGGVTKMFIYGMFFLFLFQFMDIAIDISGHSYLRTAMTTVKLYSILWIILWEMRSIGDNIESKFKKTYAIFYAIDKVIVGFEKNVVNRISNSKVCEIKDDLGDDPLKN